MESGSFEVKSGGIFRGGRSRQTKRNKSYEMLGLVFVSVFKFARGVLCQRAAGWFRSKSLNGLE